MTFDEMVFAVAYMMVIWSWQSLLVLVVTWIGVNMDRSHTAATRYKLWLAGLIACALLPLCTAASDLLPPQLPDVTSLRLVRQFATPELPQRVLPEITPPTVIERPAQFPVARLQLNRTLLWRLGIALWAIGCLLCLVRLGTSYWRTRGLRRRARPGEGRIHARVRLAYSSEISGPMLVGLWHPFVMLPADIENWTTREQRTAIVRHELAHWERGDPIVNLFQGLFGAFFFFHPMVRFALRQVNLERELACDDRVLDSGTDTAIYAEAILQAAEKGVLGRDRAASVLHSSKWILERRVKMILAAPRPHSGRGWRIVSGTVVLISLVAVTGLLAFRGPQDTDRLSSSQGMSDFKVPNFPPSYELHIKATPADRGPDSESNSGPGFWSRHATGLRQILAEIYGVEPSRIDLPVTMDGSKRYDLDLVLPNDEADETIHRLVQRGIEKELGVRMSLELRTMDVYVLTAMDRIAAFELPVKDGFFSHSSVEFQLTGPFFGVAAMRSAEEVRLQTLASGARGTTKPIGGLSSNGRVTEFVRSLESSLDLLVIDETHLEGRYELRLNTNSQARGTTVADMLKEQLGLVLTPAKRNVGIIAVRTVDASSTIPLTDVGPLGNSSSSPTPTALPAASTPNVRPEDVRVIGLDSDGVTLISPSTPGFDARVEVAAPGWGHIAKQVKPYVVLVSNESKRKIVAYELEWSMIGANGRSQAQRARMNDPDAVAGDFNAGTSNAQAVPPGKERLTASDFQVSEYKPFVDEALGPWIQTVLRNYENVRKVEIRLIAVIFDNGVLVGQDQSFVSQFESLLKAKQDVYRNLANRIDGGASVEAAFEAIRQAMPQDPTTSRFEIYAQLAFTEAQDLRKKFGDARLRDVLRQAVLKEPFVVRRE